MMIDMKVFDNLKFPWFWFEMGENGKMIGEDVYFCREAGKAGFEVWCDPRIEVKHIGTFEY